MKILEGKNVLIVGVANKHSIAAGIAKSMSEHGADLFLSYQSERLLKKSPRLEILWDVKIILNAM